MTDYQKLYHLLFNAVTDARESLEKLDVAAAVRLLEDVKQGAPAGAPCLYAGKFENVKNFS